MLNSREKLSFSPPQSCICSAEAHPALLSSISQHSHAQLDKLLSEGSSCAPGEAEGRSGSFEEYIMPLPPQEAARLGTREVSNLIRQEGATIQARLGERGRRQRMGGWGAGGELYEIWWRERAGRDEEKAWRLVWLT